MPKLSQAVIENKFRGYKKLPNYSFPECIGNSACHLFLWNKNTDQVKRYEKGKNIRGFCTYISIARSIKHVNEHYLYIPFEKGIVPICPQLPNEKIWDLMFNSWEDVMNYFHNIPLSVVKSIVLMVSKKTAIRLDAA